MKKLRLFIVTIVCVAMLIACEAKDPENVFEMQPTETQLHTTPATEPEKESQPETAPQIDFQEEVTLSVPYQYGNMQINSPSGNFMDYGDQILFLERNAARRTFVLYTLDKATGKVSLFCTDATCMHSNPKKCVSAGIDSNLEQYDGRIYGKNLDGQVMELKNGRFEQITEGEVISFWHADGRLYAVTADRSLVVFENGSEKPRVLMDEYTSYKNVVLGQYLYGNSVANGVTRVDLLAENPQEEVIVSNAAHMTDTTHIYYIDRQTYCLYRCNMDGSEQEQLTEEQVLPASLNFDEEYLYFRLYTDQDLEGADCNELYRLSKGDPTQIEKIAEFPDTVAYQVYTVPGYGKIFVVTYIPAHTENGKQVEQTNVYYLVAKDGSSVEKLELPNS